MVFELTNLDKNVFSNVLYDNGKELPLPSKLI